MALDPLYEPAQRQLIQLYAWHEQPATALRQYEQCVQVLDKELGAPLNRPLRSFIKRLRRAVCPIHRSIRHG
ncbi:MAG: bacterial transcriptional activator domain-containing protein [Caldilineaceae bacterium]